MLAKPRLATIQDEGFDEFKNLIDNYIEWRDFEEFLVLSKPKMKKPLENDYLFVECRKRGNEKYCRMLDQKLRHFIKTFWINNLQCYGLFITLTCKTDRFYGVEWDTITKRFNVFLNWIRRRLKSSFIGIYRVLEATKKGYPHIHFCLFTKHPVFIPQKALNERWGAYTWVSRIRSIRAVMHYLRKYLSKTYQDNKHLLTAALLWYYRKRSFSISKSLLFYLIQEKRNSFQMDLYGEIKVEKWAFVGIMTRIEIKSEGLEGLFV